MHTHGFGKKLNFPSSALLLTILPCFGSIYVFPLLYAFLSSPCFHHDAFMHHTIHVLDTPVSVCVSLEFIFKLCTCILVRSDIGFYPINEDNNINVCEPV